VKVLIAEDDFVSRKLLQAILSPYGECHIAVNGKEALLAFELAWKERTPYDLICMDIMMPEMDGHEALNRIRRLEAGKGIPASEGAKVIMTTALKDRTNVMNAYKSQCDAYLTKPFDRMRLLDEIKKMHLIE
jgi:two-component system, chemotaxis family, chemotaxis protein CheY